MVVVGGLDDYLAQAAMNCGSRHWRER